MQVETMFPDGSLQEGVHTLLLEWRGLYTPSKVQGIFKCPYIFFLMLFRNTKRSAQF